MANSGPATSVTANTQTSATPTTALSPLNTNWSSASGTALVRPDGTTMPVSTGAYRNGPLVVCAGDSTMVGNYNNTCLGSGLSGLGTTVTVTLAGHGLMSGITAFIGGADNNAFNGTYVLTVTNSNVFTYQVPVSFGTRAVTDTSATISVIVDSAQQDRNFVAIAAAQNGWNVDRIIQRCYDGLTSTYQVAHFSQDVLSLNPNVVAWMGFTNDIRNGDTFATITGNITSMMNATLATGAIFIMCTGTPFDSGATGYSTAKLDVFNRVNNWIRQTASKTAGVYLLDAFALATDGTSATGNFKANYSIADKIHLSDLGAYRIAVNTSPAATDFSTLLGQLFPTNKRYGISSQRDDFFVTNQATNYCANPLMIGAGGTVSGGGTSTGTAPNSWTVTNSGGPTTAWSTPARADGLGNDILATLSGTGTGQLNMIGTNIIGTKSPLVGEVWQVACNVQVLTGIANITSIQCFIDAVIGGLETTMFSAIGATGNTPYWADAFNLYYRSAPFVITQQMVTAGITTWQPRVTINIGTAAATTLKVGLFEMRLRDLA